MDYINELPSLIASCAMIIGPVIGYVFQYFDIKREKSAKGFSSKVCLVLLIANILRLFFWYGLPFDNALALQSVLMIIVQIILLRVWHEYELGNTVGKIFIQRNDEFWSWTDFSKYMKFLGFFITSIGILTLVQTLLINDPLYFQIIGVFSLLIESTLPLPQIYKNYTNRSVDFNLVLFFSWIGGDSLKTIYFYFSGAPFQFMICGIIQLSLDVVILIQMLMYKKNESTVQENI
eukprot:TRINITY_DN14635_c0_g1_i1.p1 TRINITY_DN14635_c0_g1~~TRINITY_DN14635_c0_g1_i1.p1  ORF type:complete len:234 (+),score=38.88 TRINITY_DN14635_c0_g1_i1:62-763(+)